MSQARNQGSRKTCCGSYCLREGRRFCCVHVPPQLTDISFHGFCRWCEGRPHQTHRHSYRTPAPLADLVGINTNQNRHQQRNIVEDWNPPASLTEFSGGNAGREGYLRPDWNPTFPTASESSATRTLAWDPTFPPTAPEFPAETCCATSESESQSSSFDLEVATREVELVGDKDLRKCLRTCLSAMECPICLDLYSSKVCTFQCGHSVCLSHVKSLRKCPICRQPLSFVSYRSRTPRSSVALKDSVAALEEAVHMMLRIDAESRQQRYEAAPCKLLVVEGGDDDEVNKEGGVLGKGNLTGDSDPTLTPASLSKSKASESPEAVPMSLDQVGNESSSDWWVFEDHSGRNVQSDVAAIANL